MLSAIAISSGRDEETLVLVDAYLGWWRLPSLLHRFQKRLLDDTGLNRDQLIFAPTHTHASAPLRVRDDSLPGGEFISD